MLTNIKNVLVVEDDPVEFSIVKKAVMGLSGHELLLSHASDGEEAINFLSKNDRPQLILLDLNMPRMNGIELLHFLKQHPLYQDIPVVIFTTSADNNDRSECFKKGAAGYVVKPIDYPEYVNAVQTLLKYWDESSTEGKQ